MNSEELVNVENVSKKFCRNLKRSLWYGVQDMARDILGHENSPELRRDEFRALDNISFSLKRGECLGLIGKNGSGKSTLLKMLNGLLKPDSGKITIYGRTGALIELGAGFNPILTGRENIYVNASILGLTKKETDLLLDSIIEFAEIGEFIDAPVQSYSSGMKVRLGFSVAIHIKPDVLLIDEVLAVGDIGFVMKCFNKIDELLANTAIIFVSHNMQQISRVCSQVMLIDRGLTIYNGNNVSEAIDEYYSSFKFPESSFVHNDEVSLNKIRLNNTDIHGVGSLVRVQRLTNLDIELEFEINAAYKNPELKIVFCDRELRSVATFISDDKSTKIINKNGHVSVRVHFSEIPFSKGVFSITVGLTDRTNGKVLFRMQEVACFQVLSAYQVWTPVQLEGQLTQLNC